MGIRSVADAGQVLTSYLAKLTAEERNSANEVVDAMMAEAARFRGAAVATRNTATIMAGKRCMEHAIPEAVRSGACVCRGANRGDVSPAF